MDKTLYIGIDPGAKGAICYLYDGNIKFEDMNLSDVTTHYNTLRLTKNCNSVAIVIEDVHSLFGMSAKSNFNFGRNLGVIQTVVDIATDCGYIKVPPKTWQKHFGITGKSGEIKKTVAAKCIELYPGCAIYGPKGGLRDGRSDALLLATYLQQIGKKQYE